MFSRTTTQIAFLLVVVVHLGGCSGEPEKGRFVVAEPTPVPRSTIVVPAPSPAPSTSALETIMQHADTNSVPPESAKLYLQMSEEEQYEFIEQRARHVSRMIGSGTYEFSRPSISYIKQYVDAYAHRVSNGSKVTWGEDLNNVFGRAQRYAPVIIRAFNGRRIPPAIGLYLVAVETEYTNFAQENEAGAAGLFQFIPSTAEAYGVPANQRTNVDRMSQAAAHYVADRIGEFGTDPMSVALCIAGYNRSPDSVRSDLQSV
ncbi:MAG TPA: transglycosylase SLT domain-containing protein, partial [Pyrinomonadaceae bacterium]